MLVNEADVEFRRLGYSVALCCHCHRDADARSSHAARLKQRWWLTFTDLRTAGNDKFRPTQIVPNRCLGCSPHSRGAPLCPLPHVPASTAPERAP